jgi:hypothetical protein
VEGIEGDDGFDEVEWRQQGLEVAHFVGLRSDFDL